MTDLVRHLFDGYVPDDDQPSDPPQTEDEEDDTIVPHTAKYPKCRTCNDPNLSLESDRCIICRIT